MEQSQASKADAKMKMVMRFFCLATAAAKSNQALREIGTDIQWQESFVAANKTFCVYLAKNEDVIRRHAKLSGFPASKITEIGKMIDTTTGE